MQATRKNNFQVMQNNTLLSHMDNYNVYLVCNQNIKNQENTLCLLHCYNNQDPGYKKYFLFKTKTTKNTTECMFLQSFLIKNEMIQIMFFNLFNNDIDMCDKMNENIKSC